MFQEIPVNEPNIFAFKAIGRLTEQDYQAFLPKLTGLLKEHSPLSLLIELEDFHGWELKAAWEDFKFGKDHDADFERIAIIGDKQWQRWMTALGKGFISTEVRFFKRDELQKAWDWLRGIDAGEQVGAQTTAEIEPLKPYSHIVVAVDFSPHSERAVSRALELARLYKARLSLIHTVEHIAYPYYDYDMLMSTPYDFLDEDQPIHDSAVKRLKHIAAELDYPDVQYEVLWGVAKTTVLSYAEAQNADLIVAGSHGRHGIARLMGSTSTGIVGNARCDVTIVRLPDQ